MFFDSFFSADPTEHKNLAKKRPQALKALKRLFKFLRKSEVPSLHKKADMHGAPNLYNYTYASGWCT